MNRNNTQPAYQAYDDEIDLFELVEDLWSQKWLIIAITVLVTVAAVIYAMRQTPIYEATSRVMAPSESDVTELNAARLALSTLGDQSLPAEYSPERVYTIFKRELQSQSLRNQFLEEHYLPFMGKASDADQLGQTARDTMQRRLSGILQVIQPDARGRPDVFQVRVELDDPQVAAEWANLYVTMASERSKDRLLTDVMADLNSRSQALKRRLETMRTQAKQAREDRMVRLQDALQVANTLGLEASQLTAGRTSSDSTLAAFVEGDLMYLRGAQALQAELSALSARDDDDPYISGLRAMQLRLDVLDRATLDRAEIAVFTLDSSAEAPSTPIKPRKSLIVAVGIVLGGMIAVVVASVRIVIRRRKQRLIKDSAEDVS